MQHVTAEVSAGAAQITSCAASAGSTDVSVGANTHNELLSESDQRQIRRQEKQQETEESHFNTGPVSESDDKQRTHFSEDYMYCRCVSLYINI